MLGVDNCVHMQAVGRVSLDLDQKETVPGLTKSTGTAYLLYRWQSDHPANTMTKQHESAVAPAWPSSSWALGFVRLCLAL